MTDLTLPPPANGLRSLRERHARHANSADLAYWTIRDAIRTGLIAPGERLIELDLAASLEMSRTPVREALRRLATERLIDSHAGRGFIVPTTTIDELVDLYEIRGALEGLSARRAATRMSGAQVLAMKETIDRMHRALETSDLIALSQASVQFHRLLRPGSRDSRLSELIRLVTDAVPGLSAHEMAPDRVDAAIAEHEAIYNAIANHLPDEAERLTRIH